MTANIDSTQPPKVSVIIPTYNRAEDLNRCLESLTVQIFKDFEVLICDDGSTDDSQNTVKSFSNRLKISYFWNENFGGPARPRNIGLKYAKGEYVAFLDADDWWHPEKLQASVEMLDAGADVVYHDLYLISSLAAKPRFWKRARTRQVKQPVFRDLLLNGNAICNSSVVVRKDLMNKIGGFSEDPSLIAAEDYEAWLRLAHQTEAFVRITNPLGYYWAGGGNISTAERLIRNLERLSELYQDKEHERSFFSCSPSYSYVMGNAKYALGQFNSARSNYLKVMAFKKINALFFKSLIWWVITSLRVWKRRNVV